MVTNGSQLMYWVAQPPKHFLSFTVLIRQKLTVLQALCETLCTEGTVISSYPRRMPNFRETKYLYLFKVKKPQSRDMN